jgi:ABC-type uncharacterized transport system substrate-binding protein
VPLIHSLRCSVIKVNGCRTTSDRSSAGCRFAPAGVQAQALAKELVALQPDVILASSTPIVAALQRESRTIPIVFVQIADPIGSGFVASLARPGGNITGLLLFEASITGKWLALLKEIRPRLSRAALVINPKTAPYWSQYPRHGRHQSLRKGLQELGYVEGRNLVIEYRSADGRAERFPDLASELVRLKVDLIMTRGTPATIAAKKRDRNDSGGYGDDGRPGCHSCRASRIRGATLLG